MNRGLTELESKHYESAKPPTSRLAATSRQRRYNEEPRRGRCNIAHIGNLVKNRGMYRRYIVIIRHGKYCKVYRDNYTNGNASMAAQAALTCAQVTCLRHSSMKAQGTAELSCCPKVSARAQVLSAIRRRTRWVTSLGLRTRPHNSGSGPRRLYTTEVFWQPRSAHVAHTPISLFNCHGRRTVSAC